MKKPFKKFNKIMKSGSLVEVVKLASKTKKEKVKLERDLILVK